MEVCIDRHSTWNKFPVYDLLLVKETNQFHLQFAFLHTWFFGSWRPRTLPLRRLQFCLWVVSINDAFIACDYVQEQCGIVYHSFLQFLPDRYSTVFLILGQHSRHKLRCNPMHENLFCQNSLTRSITNSNLCTEIVYGTTTILVDSRPYLFHFWGGSCRAWRTWLIIISSEVLPFLKRPNHSKVRLRLMHESPKACFNISKVSLPVLPNLTQNMMHNLCTSTSAIPPISENRRRQMQYTHKDTWNYQTLPYKTTPLGTLTNKKTATYPSGKLVNYKRLVCYEHCPGTFRYTFAVHSLEKQLTYGKRLHSLSADNYDIANLSSIAKENMMNSHDKFRRGHSWIYVS